MKNDITVSWKEIFDQYPEDEKAEIIERTKVAVAKDRAIIKFRSVKQAIRKHLLSSTDLSPVAIREIEKHTDFLLSVFRQAVEDEGGKFEVNLDFPDHVSYNLFDLRDEYEDVEGSPLGPFYEEEDMNESTKIDERGEPEKLESEMEDHHKVVV